jgi:hypothetical protein
VTGGRKRQYCDGMVCCVPWRCEETVEEVEGVEVEGSGMGQEADMNLGRGMGRQPELRESSHVAHPHDRPVAHK